MELLLGSSLPVFIGVTLIMGFAAFMTGQAVASTWRPVRQVFLFCLLLGFAGRFLSWSLFEGDILSISGFVIAVVVATLISLSAYRLTHASMMVRQYPWLYERAGPWRYREKPPSGEGS